MNTNQEKEISYREFITRENEIVHAPYQKEFLFYEAVKCGELEKVKLLLQTQLDQKEGLGELSKNPLRNLKYHFVVTAAMLARFCIEGGMEHGMAYNLSDYYIQKVDTADSPQEITDLHRQMAIAYTKRMKELQKKRICSKPVIQCIEYIYNHLHERIYLAELAAHVGLNQSYLSRLFKKEMDCSITCYIQDKKIQTAQNMLKYSEYQLGDIANILAFPTQSYFSVVFEKKTGQTPGKYREQSFRKILVKQG